MPPLNRFTHSCIALAISQAMTMPANAATITVNSHLDDGTGCSLREAIVSINSASMQAGCNNTGSAYGTNDQIIFSGLVSNTINLSQGQLSIATGKTIVINGIGINDLTINAGGGSRILYIKGAMNSPTVGLSNLTLSGGAANGEGGGIYISNASLDMTNSTVTGNSSSQEGGGIFARYANVQLSGSTLVGNSSGRHGGGFYAFNSNLNLINSAVSANSVMFSGGGLYAYNSSVSIAETTISANSAPREGGGVRATSSSVNLTNTTLSGNEGLPGGGIFARSASISLLNATVTGNSSTSDGGGIFVESSSISLANSLIAGNRSGGSGNEIIDYYGFSTFTHLGVNLFGDSGESNSQAFDTFTPGANDLTATSNGNTATALNSILSPLSGNGGPTLTHPLVLNSPAIDQGGIAVCPVIDQRGEARNDSSCDIGAVEVQSMAIINVNSAADTSGGMDCTLRDAILSSNNFTPTGGCSAGGSMSSQILFDTISNISLVSVLPTITSDLSLDGGAGLTIDAVNTGSVLIIDGATVNLSALRLTGGSAQYGGGILADNFASVNLINSTVEGNSALMHGGGISATNESWISLNNSTVSDNVAVNGRGGGIHVYMSSGVSLNSSTVSSNSATEFGGGISAFGSSSVNLSNSTVSGNSALAYFGGGIWAFLNCSVNLINSTVSSNLANNGGGMLTQFSSVNISNSIVAGNSAAGYDEMFNPEDSSTYLTNNNIFGDTRNTSYTAFKNFTPDGTDITATVNGTVPSALVSILKPLTDNGGPTLTHELAARSPAINAGDPVACTNNMITLDQRGEKRDARCDIGAFEAIEESSFFVVPLPNNKSVIFSL